MGERELDRRDNIQQLSDFTTTITTETSSNPRCSRNGEESSGREGWQRQEIKFSFKLPPLKAQSKALQLLAVLH